MVLGGRSAGGSCFYVRTVQAGSGRGAFFASSDGGGDCDLAPGDVDDDRW